MVTQSHQVEFTSDELSTWSAFATLLEWLPAALDRQLQQDSEMTHFEFGILFALHRAEERTLRMSALAEYANSTLSRLSRAVGRLEQRGWVRRSPDPRDGRITTATLTANGLGVILSATPGHVALVRKTVFDSLTKKQTTQLERISVQIARAINAGGQWSPDS